MPAKITLMKDQPVVVAFLSGSISHDDLVTITEQTQHFMANEQRIYRIMDVREADSISGDTLSLMNDGSHITAAIVGSNDLSLHNIPVFTDMDDALNYVR
ncbi:MAG: hypothetical protein L0154_06830, partial [Chloroflexi bacterium]|nr:hypothetical protein [Chloroflexota bacterium]